MTHKFIVQWLLVISSLLPLAACANTLTYSAEPITAQVIDADTQQPIKGVVVTANWQLEEGTFGGNVPAGQLMVMESVTDNEGKFSFPAWGPKRAPKGHLVADDPQLLLFKSGYEYRRLNNPYSSDRELRLRPVRRSVWNGRVIMLKPFGGSPDAYAKHLSFMPLSWAYNGDDCEWKKIPQLVAAVNKQAIAFQRQGIMSDLYTFGSLIPLPGYSDKCGAREYFKERNP